MERNRHTCRNVCGTSRFSVVCAFAVWKTWVKGQQFLSWYLCTCGALLVFVLLLAVLPAFCFKFENISVTVIHSDRDTKTSQPVSTEYVTAMATVFASKASLSNTLATCMSLWLQWSLLACTKGILCGWWTVTRKAIQIRCFDTCSLDESYC